MSQVKECLPRLAKLIKSNNEAVLRDACWGVMYMCKLRYFIVQMLYKYMRQ